MQLLVPTLLAALFAASQAFKCDVCKDPDTCQTKPNPTDCSGYCTYLKYDKAEIRTCNPTADIIYGPKNLLFKTAGDCTKITADTVDYIMKICNTDNCNAECTFDIATTTPKGTATLTPLTFLNVLLCFYAATRLL